MSFLIWFIAGGIAGWLAGFVLRTDAHLRILLNILVPVVGALLGGFLVLHSVGVPDINTGTVTVGSMLVSLVGAVTLLEVVKLARKKR